MIGLHRVPLAAWLHPALIESSIDATIRHRAPAQMHR